jgi:hypothetical protein
MKTKSLRVFFLSIAAGGLVWVCGCVVEPNGRVVGVWPFVVVAPPPVVYAAPPPVVYAAPPPDVYAAPVMIPDSYVWDGYEYVGFVGDQYYYLGPGNVWLFCEPFRLERFHGWERDHGDWRNHAIRNDRYRTDRNGHVQPRHDDKQGKDRRDEH